MSKQEREVMVATRLICMLYDKLGPECVVESADACKVGFQFITFDNRRYLITVEELDLAQFIADGIQPCDGGACDPF